MSSFNWLHLTDLHYGLTNYASHWSNVREAFWHDLKKLYERSGPWHAIFFTGDLVNTGSKNEFEELEDKVIAPLRSYLTELGGITPILLTVPGNHDLNRPNNKQPKAALRLMLQENGFKSIAEEFWTDPDSEYREIVIDAFQNYDSWSCKNNEMENVELIKGLLPGDFLATIKVTTESDELLRIGIAGMNSSFLQLSAGDFNK